MPRGALWYALVLLRRTVLASAIGEHHIGAFVYGLRRPIRPRRSAACRAIPGCSSVMRWRSSALIAFLVNRKKAGLDQPCRSGITGSTTQKYLASLNLLRRHIS